MSRAVHRGPAEDHVRALLRLVCVATALGAASGASHASMTDSSSSFEAARRPSLRLGFVDDSVDPAALRAVHADKVGGRPRWPRAPPPELHAPPCPACGGAMPFILSVAPPPRASGGRQDCLHVFACAESACAYATNTARVFRSQRRLPESTGPDTACADPAPEAPPPGAAGGGMPALVLRERGLDFEEFPDEDGFLDDEDRIAELIRNYH